MKQPRNETLSLELIEAFREKFDSDPGMKLRMNATVKNGVDSTAIDYRAISDMRHTFSIELETGKITAQKQSGRCWLFAACNTMRMEVMRRCNLDTFELSQAWLFFWDKLEKSNYFLENILETLDEPTDSQLIIWLLGAPVNDGGQWEMVTSLVAKYGVVPKYAMPESFSSSQSARLNKFLTLKLREYASILREEHQKGSSVEELASRKEEMLREVYDMLCICLGTPPKTFDFEYRDKDKKFTRDRGLTPHKFYDKYVGRVLDDYISLINAPTADKPYYNTFTVRFLGNVRGGRSVKYLNLPVEELKKLAVDQLSDSEPVWFGCDVGQMLDRDSGTMCMDTFDVENLFRMRFGLDKAGRLDYRESCMTHAMVFMGVNILDGKPNRWKVENSWGDKIGNDGWFIMSDDWFSEYTYQVVINKKHLSKKLLAAYEQSPIVLAPWDPMGSLA